MFAALRTLACAPRAATSLAATARGFHSTGVAHIRAPRKGLYPVSRRPPEPQIDGKPLFQIAKEKLFEREQEVRVQREALALVPVIHMPEPKLQSWVVDMENARVGMTDLHPDVFDQVIRKDIVHRVVLWQLAKRRGPQHDGVSGNYIRGKNEVSGSNRKPHPQKGTGRARQGNKRAPHLKKGGKAMGSQNKDFSFALQRKVRKLGVKIALTAKFREGNLFIVDKPELDSHKSGSLQRNIYQNWNISTVLLVHAEDELDPNLALAARSLQYFDFLPSKAVNVYDLLRHSQLIISVKGLEELTARLTAPDRTTRRIVHLVDLPPPKLRPPLERFETEKERNLIARMRKKSRWMKYNNIAPGSPEAQMYEPKM